MIEKITIDDEFIDKWQRRYEETEDDEGEYQNIVAKVKEEIDKSHSISKELFIRILYWKAPRVTGIIKLDAYDTTYSPAVRKCIGAADNDKIGILDALYGIGGPVASTIIHFIFPSSFPIIDIRTADVLFYSAKLLNSRSTDLKNYPPFRSIMLNIVHKHPQWTLRHLDRALFAYDKIELDPKLKSLNQNISEG